MRIHFSSWRLPYNLVPTCSLDAWGTASPETLCPIIEIKNNCTKPNKPSHFILTIDYDYFHASFLYIVIFTGRWDLSRFDYVMIDMKEKIININVLHKCNISKELYLRKLNVKLMSLFIIRPRNSEEILRIFYGNDLRVNERIVVVCVSYSSII